MMTADERLAQYQAFLRRLERVGISTRTSNAMASELRELVAAMPPEVDPDVLAVREICRSHRAGTGWENADWFMGGCFDKGDSMTLALTAYRAGKAAR